MRERYLRLAHDVGKYVARTARNLRGPADPELVRMLIRDLYELKPRVRASQLFAELASGLEHPALARVAALLGETDALEPLVRRHDPTAVASAARLACEVERRLRELVES
jgi:hypothetical protein